MKERYIITNINPMKTKTIIEELTQEDLVDLLCTATYGSSWLEIYALDQDGCGIVREDCAEDRWAKVLLSGKTISFVDHYAEEIHYGELPYEIDRAEDGDGNVTYEVSLKDIINGLQRCADGTFKVNGKHEREYMFNCFDTFKESDGGMDNPQAEALVQIIIFGELIYG